MKKLILVALNDNDDIWFNCFIPFTITLKNTNYDGEIGVISYNLSDNKKEILIKNQIQVFEAFNICHNLLLDRFISTSKIAEHYDIIALYDVDIWFPKHDLTLFKQVQDNSLVYCCYDVIIPPFILNGAKDKTEVKSKLDNLLTKQDYYWQAGLTVAHRQAWIKYGEYILNYLNKGNYQLEYGIDATILNLYSAETNNVSLLNKKYNCLPFWGINIDKVNFFPLRVDNEEIEGVHITRYHRDTSDFSFLKTHLDVYLEKGEKFLPEKPSLYHYQNCNNLLYNINNKHDNPFYCNEIFCHSFSYQWLNENLLAIDAIDTFEMKLTYTGREPCQIAIGYQAILNKHQPVKFKVYLNGRDIMALKDTMLPITINLNDELIIQSLHLREDFGVRILLSQVNFPN